MSIKEKAVSGLLWSFLEDLARSGILFGCGIILARLLSPREFGLIGMTTGFMALSQAFVESGFNQALIRKQDCTQADYSTVFYFNVLVSLFFYLLLVMASGMIGRFFGEPQLTGILRVLGLGLVVGALGRVQQTQLTKALDFKLLTRISVVSSLLAGLLAIGLAHAGYGVWSLVVMTLTRSTVELILLWLWRRWRPSPTFCWVSFREMFTFGSRLLASSMIGTLNLYTYNLVIGKFFSAAELGQFTQAQTFRNLLSQRLTDVVQRVSYPVLATLQQDPARLRNAFRRVIRSVTLVTSVLLLGLAACSEALVITLVGEQWRPAVAYLQLLCFPGVLYPLHAVNLNLLKVLGRSDQVLRLSLIKASLVVPAVVAGISWGIPAMIVAVFLASLIGYVLTAIWTGRLTGYRAADQIRDILPSVALAALMAAGVYLSGCMLPLASPFKLIAQVGLGAAGTIGLAELTRMDSYLHLKGMVVDKLTKACVGSLKRKEDA